MICRSLFASMPLTLVLNSRTLPFTLMQLRIPQAKLGIIATVAILLAVASLSFRRYGPWTRPTVIRRDERLAQLPRTILWAWEIPQQLTFLDPKVTGVAFLARTIYLRDTNVVGRPRLQTLSVPEATRLIAVVRIESDRDSKPTMSVTQLQITASEILELAKLRNVQGIQIDFDAKSSEREFYRSLLYRVRSQLPDSVGLSITALASWCRGDDWLDDLPIDEAVPMLFRMGVERNQFRRALTDGVGFSTPLCRESAGISTDEAIIRLPSVKRIYVFNPTPWSESSLKQLMENLER